MKISDYRFIDSLPSKRSSLKEEDTNSDWESVPGILLRSDTSIIELSGLLPKDIYNA